MSESGRHRQRPTMSDSLQLIEIRMLHGYFNITVIEEWITFFATLLLLDRKTGRWQLFKLLMAAILIAETVGWYLRTHGHQHENAIPFNVLILITDLFLIWFFTTSSLLSKEKPVLFVLMAIFFAGFIVNLFFFQEPWVYNYYSETFADILLSVICALFIYKVLRSDEYVNLLGLDYFWLATGVLFSSLGSALLYHFSNLLHQYSENTGIDIGTYLNFSLNTLLYISLVISFICSRKATRSLQVS